MAYKDPDKKTEYARLWYIANRERALKYSCDRAKRIRKEAPTLVHQKEREYRKSAALKIKEKQRRYRDRHPEKCRERGKLYESRNREKIRERNRARYRAKVGPRTPREKRDPKIAWRLYYVNHKDRKLAQGKKWQSANPERYKELIRSSHRKRREPNAIKKLIGVIQDAPENLILVAKKVRETRKAIDAFYKNKT